MWLSVAPGTKTYTGHIIGECGKVQPNDLDVNPTRVKHQTNVRTHTDSEFYRLSPIRTFSLEEALVYVAPDELVEVTLRVCQGCVKGVSRVCQGCVKGMSRVCQGCVKGVSRVCQGYVKGVSRVCQGCVKSVYVARPGRTG